MISTKAQHYRYNFSAIEHIRFWYCMHRLNQDNGPKRNVKIMITYDDDPLIRALYREEHGWRIYPLKIRYASAHDPVEAREEIVICSYDADPSLARLADGADWSDIPATEVPIGGVPLDQLDCCAKERVALMLAGARKGRCRVCKATIKMEVI